VMDGESGEQKDGLRWA